LGKQKTADEIDRHLGQRVRMRRIERNISQVELATKLGISFQQLQKYESGHNRMSASRLYRMGQILDAPVGFFFEGLPPKPLETRAGPPAPEQK
jgi:transcriptional regulator with XRE-family HTH domain